MVLRHKGRLLTNNQCMVPKGVLHLSSAHTHHHTSHEILSFFLPRRIASLHFTQPNIAVHNESWTTHEAFISISIKTIIIPFSLPRATYTSNSANALTNPP